MNNAAEYTPRDIVETELLADNALDRPFSIVAPLVAPKLFRAVRGIPHRPASGVSVGDKKSFRVHVLASRMYMSEFRFLFNTDMIAMYLFRPLPSTARAATARAACPRTPHAHSALLRSQTALYCAPTARPLHPPFGRGFPIRAFGSYCQPLGMFPL
jgi:hypothetical protein